MTWGLSAARYCQELLKDNWHKGKILLHTKRALTLRGSGETLLLDHAILREAKAQKSDEILRGAAVRPSAMYGIPIQRTG